MSDRRSELEFQLDQFSESVQDLKDNFPETEVFGSTRARTPIICMYKSRWLLDALSDGSIQEEKLREYERVNEQFKQFVENYRNQYIRSILEEFEWFIERYPELICGFLERDPVDNELIETLNRRDTMEILRRYLNQLEESEYSSIEERVERAAVRIDTLDEVLRCRFIENLAELQNNHAYICKPYFPDDFWWRHLERLK